MTSCEINRTDDEKGTNQSTISEKKTNLELKRIRFPCSQFAQREKPYFYQLYQFWL